MALESLLREGCEELGRDGLLELCCPRVGFALLVSRSTDGFSLVPAEVESGGAGLCVFLWGFDRDKDEGELLMFKGVEKF
jgi:hypothetical protein